MKKESDMDLKKIYAGSSNISGTVISAFTKIIGMMYDAGKGFGSSIRRLGENNLCPLE